MGISDPRSKRITAIGAVTNQRSRLTTIYINPAASAAAGRLTLTDGSGGSTLIDLDTPATGVNPSVIVLFVAEDSGLLFLNGINVSTLTNITSVTLFYTGGT